MEKKAVSSSHDKANLDQSTDFPMEWPSSTYGIQDRTEYVPRQLEELTAELHEIKKTLSRAKMTYFSSLNNIPTTSQLIHSFDDCDTLDSQVLPPTKEAEQHGLKSAASNLLMFLTLKRNLLAEELKQKSSSFSRVPESSPSQSHVKCSTSFTNENRKVFGIPFDIIGNFVDNPIFGNFVDNPIFGVFDRSMRRTKSVDNIVKEEFDSTVIPITNQQHNESTTYNSSASPICIQSSSENCSHPQEVKTMVGTGTMQDKDFNQLHQSKTKDDEIDPKLLAEIEDFEKMAAKYLKEHQS